MRSYKDNVKYFTKWEGTNTLGLGMLIVGFLSLWLARSFLMYIGGGLLVFAGFIVFLVGNIGRSNESEILSEVDRRKGGIEFPEAETERDYQRRVPARPEIFDFEGFVFRDGVHIKKMKNGSLCSSEYAKARIYPLTDGFWIRCRTFSLIEDGECNETYDIPFSSVENIETESERRILHSGKKAFSAKVCHFVITYDGGKKLYLPGHDDAQTDELIEKFKKLVRDSLSAKEE